MSKKIINIALLVGGASPERPVSKSSSLGIFDALNKLNYKVKLIDPAYGKNQPNKVEDFFSEEDHYPVSNKNYIDAVNSSHLNGIDTVFIGLHGKWGEDGTIQSLLELKNLPYTGSGVLASALSMDKSMSKVMFQHFDVQTPKWFVVDRCDTNYDLVKTKIQKFFGYPCIVKPNDQGSTIGLTICRGDVEVEEAVKLACKYSQTILIEEYIPGHELSVGILENFALPVLEIKPKHYLYDYECKYTDGMSEYIVPAEIPDKVSKHLQQQALLAYRSVGANAYGRVDFRVTEDWKSFCLEANTLPGMTSHSLVPKMAKAVGIGFEELVDRIVKFALR